jgi:transposase
MTKHKTEDYKISAVKYYLNNDKGDGYKNGCGYWNRDVNGATNIYKIAYNAINNKESPNYLSRSNNLSGILEEFPK